MLFAPNFNTPPQENASHMPTSSLPVLMYHYISNYPGSISISPELFEIHCREMARAGWRGVSLDQAEEYFINGRPLPAKSILITFDDGYLDNYLYAWPILKRYEHKGVIFAVTNYIENSDQVRPNMDAVWNGRISRDELAKQYDQPVKTHHLGFEQRQDLFFSWAEAREMEKSGVIRVASHSASHLAVFASDKYNGFYRPGRRNRTFYVIDEDVPWGMPKFKERPLLHSRAMRPSAALLAAIKKLVPQDKERAFRFFKDVNNMALLEQTMADLGPDNWLVPDSDEERTARMRKDIAMSRQALEENLGRSPRSFCWPWGGFCSEARALAMEEGFQVFFTTDHGANPPASPLHVKRFKVKQRPWSWLNLRLSIYSSPAIASLYAKVRR